MDHTVQSKWDIITDIFLEDGVIHFSCKLSSGTDLTINLHLVKCMYLNYNGRMDNGGRAFTKRVKYISKMYFHCVFKGD